MPQIRITRDAAEVVVQITASDADEVTKALTILRTTELSGQPAALRLLDVIHACEKDLVVSLWWEGGKGDALILPLEGRGRLDLAPLGGIHNPRHEGWIGHVRLTTRHLT